VPNRREEIIVGVAEDQDGWRLRLATLDDIDGLHSLASIPLVYRYLFDGAAPEREFIAGRIAQSLTSAADTGVGMWLLGNSSARYAGCVELRPDLPPDPQNSPICWTLNMGSGPCGENVLDCDHTSFPLAAN